MKTECIEAVLAVVEQKSFRKAADAIPCAYSTVTKQVQSVEEELGVTIFHRAPNNPQVELTPEGKFVVEYLHDMMERYNQLQAELALSHTANRNRLTIGLEGNYLGSTAISNLVAGFYIRQPEMRLSIVRFEKAELRTLLRSGEVDSILIQERGTGPDLKYESCMDPWKTTFLGNQYVEVAVTADNRTLPMKECCLRDLRKQTFIFSRNLEEQQQALNRHLKYNMHGQFLQACLDSGFTPNILKANVELKDTNFADLKTALMLKGKGIALSGVPSGIRDNSALRYIRVTDYPSFSSYYLVERTDRQNKATEAFKLYLQESLFQAE